MSKLKVLVTDPIAEKGIEELRAGDALEVDIKLGTDNKGLKESELIALAPDYHAFVIRSGVKITRPILEAAKQLKAIGRAGVGTDNIDIPTASQFGVVVMNTPGGNTISTAELAFTHILSLARSIPQANASVLAGKWERKKFNGTEISGKTLTVLGMGRIGSEVARRALAFNMRVVAYDPYLTPARAHALRVELVADLQQAMSQADFITMHMPMTPETKHMINAGNIPSLKRGVRIINCARGGLVDEAAALEGLKSGQIGGLALDVFETEPPPADHPLFALPNVAFTPHLGASTLEAQDNVGIEVAIAIREHLLNGAVVNAVNMPNLDEKTLAEAGPYIRFAEVLGRIISQIAPAHNECVTVNYSGKLGEMDTAIISRSVLKGYLERAVGADRVNLVNSTSIAEKHGLRLTESRMPEPGLYNETIEVNAGKGDNAASIVGTYFGGHPRIVQINGSRVEAKPVGTLLMYENVDRPGMVGEVGMMLGRHNVNIADMSLSRTDEGYAVTLLTLDNTPSDEMLKELEGIVGIKKVFCLKVG